MDDMKEKIIDWLATGEKGVSSEAIAFKMLDRDYSWYGFGTTPMDPDDFTRCLKLIRMVPEIRKHLHRMKEVSEKWAKMIDHWDEVEQSFMDEVPGWLDGKDYDKSAPKTYQIMQRIYK